MFIAKNFYMGWIRLSKSSMAILVFFINKKNSLLRLAQDYRALSIITTKNKYPLSIRKPNCSSTLNLKHWSLSYRPSCSCLLLKSTAEPDISLSQYYYILYLYTIFFNNL